MPEDRKTVRVAVNVMRARLTVIGFNIAIVSFQIAQLGRAAGGLSVPGIERSVHVVADLQLFMALGLSLIALPTFIMSSEFDEVGSCTHWSLMAGDRVFVLGDIHGCLEMLKRLMDKIEWRPDEDLNDLIDAHETYSNIGDDPFLGSPLSMPTMAATRS